MRRTAILLYVFALLLLGWAVGYFAGLSESPVAATLLPLLFGLLSAGGGLYAMRLDLSRTSTLARLRFVGVAGVAFVVACILGSMYGISLRTGVGLGAFLPRFGEQKSIRHVARLDTLSFREGARFIAIRSRLRMLGADEREIRAILSAPDIATRRSATRHPDSAAIAQLVPAMRSAQAQVARLIEAQGRTPDSTSYDEQEGTDWSSWLGSLWVELLRAQPVVEGYAVEASRAYVKLEGERFQVFKNLFEALDSVTSQPGELRAEAARAKLDATVLPTLQGLVHRVSRPGFDESDEYSDVAQDLNDVIRLMHEQRDEESKPRRPSIRE